MLIFDEADRMLQMGFGQDAEKIAAETRWRKQTLLFSATLEGELLIDFADRLLHEPVKIDAEASFQDFVSITDLLAKNDIKNVAIVSMKDKGGNAGSSSAPAAK